MDLRSTIVERVRDETTEGLHDVIEDTVGKGELALPSIGVLFEIIWQNSTTADRQRMVSVLDHHLKSLKVPQRS